MKKVKLSLVFAFLWLNGYVQNSHQIDSLKHQLTIVKQDTTKVKILLEICNYYRWDAPDSTLKYVPEGLKLAEKLKMFEQQTYLLLAKGEALTGKGNYSQALETQFNALKISEKVDNNYLKMWTLASVGAVYYFSNDYPRSLKYYKEAKAISDKIDSKDGYIMCFIGESYFYMNQIDTALFYIQKSYEQVIKNKVHWSIPYFFMAAINAKKGNYTKALQFYHAGLSFENPVADSVSGYIGLAGVFKEMGIIDSSVFYANRALILSQRTLFNKKIIEASQLLKEIYKSRHLIDSAFKYQEIMIAAKDSSFSQEKIKQMEKLIKRK